MNAVAQVIAFPANHPVDRLGELKAQIANLQAEADKIAEDLRAKGKGAYEGSLFKASVSDESLVQSFNGAKAKAKLAELGVSPEWIAANLIDVSVRKASVTVRAR
jgi:hypothetical protein